MSQDECDGELFLGRNLSASFLFGSVQILSGRYLTTLSNRGEKKSNVLDEINRTHVNSYRYGLLLIFNFFEAPRPQSLVWSRSTRLRLCYHLLDAARKAE